MEARATERFAMMAFGWPKVGYIRQNCITMISFFAASIGEVCNCRQKQGRDVSRKVNKCGVKITRSHITSIGTIAFCVRRGIFPCVELITYLSKERPFHWLILVAENIMFYLFPNWQ